MGLVVNLGEMGKKRALPNWLPSGWKMEVKARKKGKKEKVLFLLTPLSLILLHFPFVFL